MPNFGTIESVHWAARSGSGVVLDIRATSAALRKQERPIGVEAVEFVPTAPGVGQSSVP